MYSCCHLIAEGGRAGTHKRVRGGGTCFYSRHTLMIKNLVCNINVNSFMRVEPLWSHHLHLEIKFPIHAFWEHTQSTTIFCILKDIATIFSAKSPLKKFKSLLLTLRLFFFNLCNYPVLWGCFQKKYSNIYITFKYPKHFALQFWFDPVSSRTINMELFSISRKIKLKRTMHGYTS